VEALPAGQRTGWAPLFTSPSARRGTMTRRFTSRLAAQRQTSMLMLSSSSCKGEAFVLVFNPLQRRPSLSLRSLRSQSSTVRRITRRRAPAIFTCALCACEDVQARAVKDTARALIFRAGRRPPKDPRHDRAGRGGLRRGSNTRGGVMVLAARFTRLSDQILRDTTFTPRLKVGR
jgi:hypothetical protein